MFRAGKMWHASCNVFIAGKGGMSTDAEKRCVQQRGCPVLQKGERKGIIYAGRQKKMRGVFDEIRSFQA